MMVDWMAFLCLALAVWTALIGGVFKAFSEFVMAGLLRAKPAGGIEAMQQINRTVLRTEFVFALVAMGIIAPLVAVYGVIALDGVARAALVLAALIYVPSVFLMTIAGNVPMSNRLDRLDQTSDEAARYWTAYGRDWTRLNHFRTLGCILTAALYAVAAYAVSSS